MIARTVVAAAALALAACPTPIVAVKFGEDFTDTLKKKPEPLKGPTYARDFDGTQIFADDLSTMYMHGLTCGACMAVLNETKTLYDRIGGDKVSSPGRRHGGVDVRLHARSDGTRGILRWERAGGEVWVE